MNACNAPFTKRGVCGLLHAEQAANSRVPATPGRGEEQRERGPKSVCSDSPSPRARPPNIQRHVKTLPSPKTRGRGQRHTSQKIPAFPVFATPVRFFSVFNIRAEGRELSDNAVFYRVMGRTECRWCESGFSRLSRGIHGPFATRFRRAKGP